MKAIAAVGNPKPGSHSTYTTDDSPAHSAAQWGRIVIDAAKTGAER
ncbi:hypothetical protein OG241_37065 [Streptomyces sp. NBC_01390]